MQRPSATVRTAPVASTSHEPEPQTIHTGRSTLERVAGWGSLITRLLGATSVIVIGVIHLAAYGGPYAAVPTIGPLFLVNFFAAAAIGLALLIPLERLLGRWGGAAVVIASVGGIVLAAGTLVMLVISEHGTLFGFSEPGYDPDAISRSRVAEVVSVVLLTISLAVRAGAKSRPRW
jgi:hypothetical protein